jgi:hypothetical protein
MHGAKGASKTLLKTWLMTTEANFPLQLALS